MLPEPAPVKASAVALRPEPVALYSSLVMHRRLFPVAYRFTYRVFNVLIDIDRLDEANKRSRLFFR